MSGAREGGFSVLPPGAGTLVVRVRAVNAQWVRFFLRPTGTNPSARLLDEDANGGDGWTLAWRYPDEPLLAHLTINAIGANGTASRDTVLGLYHPTGDAHIVPLGRQRPTAKTATPVP